MMFVLEKDKVWLQALRQDWEDSRPFLVVGFLAPDQVFHSASTYARNTQTKHAFNLQENRRVFMQHKKDQHIRDTCAQ